MPNANKVITNFVGGIVSPRMRGRVDLPIYQRAVDDCLNFIPFPEGGARYRNGTFFVNYTRLNQKAIFIPFQFSDQQSYLIEATHLKFRFYKDNGLVLEANKSITAMTNANPGVFTSAAHGFVDGDQIFIDGLDGTTGINSRYYLVANATTDTFTLTDVFGTVISTVSSGTYIGSSGTVARVYEIDTPYTEDHLQYLQYAQSADTMYIAHQEYEPRKLIRSGHADWEINTYMRTADFIAGPEDYPRAVCFNDSGRLLFAGSKANPETVWASKAPSVGVTDFDDFGDGINATDAVIFTLAPIHGKVDSIQWLAMTSKFLVAGTFSGIRRIYGATEEEPLSPTSLTAKSVNTRGCAYALPVSDGSDLFYIQIGNKAIRSLEYDIQVDGYETIDRNLIAKHLSKPGLKQITQQQSDPDLIWVVRDDGRLLGLTYKEREDISGWHRHYLAGRYISTNNVVNQIARVLWVSFMPRPFDDEQLWLIVERQINDRTVRSVEYMADEIQYPVRGDYLTAHDYTNQTEIREAKENDERRYQDALYEFNKASVFLDMALQYDGSEFGTDSLETGFTITAVTLADPGVITAPGHNFDNGDVVYIQGVSGTIQLNNLFFEIADSDQGAGTFTLIGQGDDIVLPGKPRGKKKKKKRREGTQITLTGPVDTTAFDAFTSGGTVARLGVSLTPSNNTGNGVNLTSSGPIFTAALIGREIWKSYDVNGDGGGRMKIIAITDSTHAIVNIEVNLDSAETIPAGGWLLTTDSVSGLEHLEGESVGIVIDGGPHVSQAVVNGTVTLTSQASIVCVGLGPYLGLIKTLNIDAGGVSGSAQAKKRSVWQMGIRLLNAVGTLFGTDFYRLERIPFQTPIHNRPARLFNGTAIPSYKDRWDEDEKVSWVVQNIPAPCTLLALDVFMDTADE